MTKMVLDVVPKNPECPHVEDQVHPATVQKHCGEHRKDCVDKPDLVASTDPGGYIGRRHAKRGEKDVLLV